MKPIFWPFEPRWRAVRFLTLAAALNFGDRAAMSAVLMHLAYPAQKLRIFRLGAGSLMVVGLATAVISGMPGLFSGAGFLTAQWGPEIPLPAVGKVKLGTPLVFDIGVYFVVAGVVLMLYEAMERSRVREKVEPESQPAPTP